MCKMRRLAVLFAIASIASSVIAAYPNWANTTGDNLWKTAGNWSNSLVPTSADHPAVIRNGANYCLVESSTSASCNSLRIGVTNNLNSKFVMSGGSLDVVTDVYIGRWGGSDGSFWQMDGGTANISGSLRVSFFSNNCWLDLNGGQINVAGSLTIDESNGTGGWVNVTAGTLSLSGDQTTAIQALIDAGKIIGYGGLGDVNVVFDSTNTLVTASAVLQAYNPSPSDGASSVSTSVTMSWTAGATAVSHDLYLGTSYDAVLNATTASSEYIGNLSVTEYAASLSSGTFYYWRVDEVDSSSSVTTGTVWSFSTTPQERTWVNFDEDDDWANPNNWNPFPPALVPNSTHNVGVINYGQCVISNTTAAEAFRLRIGVSNNPNSKLVVDGGSLNVLTETVLGLWTGSGNSSLTVNSGAVNIGGPLNIGYRSGNCYVYIYGGSVTVEGDLTLNQNSTTGSLIELRGEGKLLLSGDRTDQVNSLIASGELIGYSGRSELTVAVVEGYTEVTTGYVNLEQAYMPSPEDGAINQSVSGLTLSWLPGESALTHNLYLGTSYDDVLNADESSPLLVYSNDPNTFYATGALAYDQTYYWRVDEVAASSTEAGEIWSFSTQSCGSIAANWIFDSTSTPGNNEWGNVDAWNVGYVPGVCNDASIVRRDDQKCIIPVGTAAEVNRLRIGNTNTGRSELSVEGGSLTVGTDLILGIWTGADESNLSVSSGSVYVSGNLEVSYRSDNCYVSITGGTVTVAGSIGFNSIGASGGYLDIETGSLVLEGDQQDAANSWVSSGNIIAYGGKADVVVSMVSDDTVITADASTIGKAYSPTPANHSKSVDVDADLSWLPGDYALSHNVYMSTDYQQVVDAADSSSPAFLANVSGSNTYEPGTLNTDTYYYWRVDAIGASQEWRGDIWAFKTSTCAGSVVAPNWICDAADPVDNFWTNSAYWSNSQVPGGCSDAAIIRSGSKRCIIDDDVDSIYRLRVGVSNNPASELVMTSGSLAVDTETVIGLWGGSDGSLIRLIGGELTVNGDLNISYRSNSCHLDIWNGQVYVENMLTIGGAGGQNGYIDIQDGKLILNGNRISQAASMIAAGQILSFGGDMDIIVRIEEGNTVLKSFVGDMDSNGIVNVDDLKLFAAQWLTDGNAAVSADFNSDDSVDMQDYSYIADNWLESIN